LWRGEAAGRLDLAVVAPAEGFRYTAHALEPEGNSRFTFVAETDACQRRKDTCFVD
jgi:hypothetical protein